MLRWLLRFFLPMTTYGPFGFASATTDGSDDFLYTADNGNQTNDTLPATTGNQQLWWNTGDTTSTDVGPTGGQETDGYLHIESSDTDTGFDDEYYIEFDTTLNCALEQFQFNFYTNQRGADNNVTCQIQINENAGGWVDVGSQFGGSGDADKVTTGGTQIWSSRSVDLSGGGVNVDASTRVRIKLVLPSVGGVSWHNDYGIDTIEIVGTLLAAKDQEAFRFADDDDDEDAGTFLAAQNVDVSRDAGAPFRVRVGTQMTGDPPAEAATLQYKENGDAATEWRDVP